jgi:hypothetical protein
MIHEKISNVSTVLRDMLDQVGEDARCVLRQAAVVLDAAADAVEQMETLMPIAGTGEAAQTVNPHA